MSPITALLWSALFLVLIKSLAWLVQRRMGNAGIVDGFWGWGVGALAVAYAAVGSAPEPLRLTVGLLGGLWGLRLGSYLWRRNWRTPEDFRYAQLRTEWGARAPFMLWAFFQFQNLFTLVLAGCAFATVAWAEAAPPLWAWVLAVLIWVVALGGESLADAQLQRFKRSIAPARRACDVGLWRYSRHPNYFFECLHWFAYVPLSWGSPWWPLSGLAPLVMMVLLNKVSGIPLLESHLADHLPGYRDYLRRTPRLIPGRPRS